MYIQKLRDVKLPSGLFLMEKHVLLFITILLLLTAIFRFQYLCDAPLNWDEVWSIWQSLGTFEQTYHWTPSDWPPLYFLFINVWQSMVGITPFVLRTFSLLVFMLGIPVTYRAVLEMTDSRPAAFFAAFAFTALGFAQFLSLLVRAYAPLLTLSMLALWLTVRYFKRPGVARALVLGLCLVVMFIIHYTAAFIYVLLGMYTLFTNPKRLWRWWLPAVMIFAVGLPEVLSKEELFLNRTAYNRLLDLPPLPEALASLYSVLAGSAFGALVLVTAALSLALLWKPRRQAVPILIWAATPLATYMLQSQLGLFQDVRYMWWVLPGLTVLVGIGLATLPRQAYLPAIIALGIMLAPIDFVGYQSEEYGSTFEPIDSVFTELKRFLLPGDVVVVDPRCGCAPLEVWDYYMRLHFPTGLPFVDGPEDYARVWYISRDWDRDEAMHARVAVGRIAGKYIGPPGFLVQLYEGPPDPTGILFANGIRYHGMTYVNRPAGPEGPVYHEGETIQLRLWWAADRPVDRDYSIGVYGLFRSTVVQSDRPSIVNGPIETSQWQTDRWYVDERAIPIPTSLMPGTYDLKLVIYQFWDNQHIEAEGYTDADCLLQLGSVVVHSW